MMGGEILSGRNRVVVLLALVVSTGAFVRSAYAVPRATKQQMAQMAMDSEALWYAPGSNYNAICSRLIRSGAVARDDLLGRLESLLAKADKEHDKAALNYLIGETHYWGGRTEFLNTKDKAAVLHLGDSVAQSFLAAWDAIGKAEQGSESLRLRHTITSRFNTLLGTSVCGGTLSTNIKADVVARYIDRLDAAGETPDSWPVSVRAKVFRNLCILDRMASAIPVSLPTNYTAVRDALTLAMSVGATNDALRLAAHLEEKYEAEIRKSASTLREVFGAYRMNGDPRALPCLKVLAAADPIGWLDLHEYSYKADPSLSQEQRRGYINEYLKAVAAKKSRVMDSYRVAIERLVAVGDYDVAVGVADDALENPDIPLSDARAFVWRLKGIAHERRGEKDEAANAMREASKLAFLMEGENLRELFRRGTDVGQTGNTENNGGGGE